MKTTHLVKLGNAALAFGIITSTVAGALLIATTPAEAATTADTSSAVTVGWDTTHSTAEDEKDPNYATFKDLTLTVSQTKNLVNQGITVSWAGARTTSPDTYSTNYMQVMQCWGDAAEGPDPEQCQFGAPSAAISGLMGVNTYNRDLKLGQDPAQDPTLDGPEADPDLRLDPTDDDPYSKVYRVPFRSVDGTLSKTANQISKVFDASTTNEVSAGRTGSNGTGEVAFETQTSLEAPQLGCGAAVSGSDSPRSCWLVVVPRGELNLDGSLSTTASSGRIAGSPLSASAWRNRMVVKLDFQPVSQSCPLGNAEQRIVGAENIAEAITSWQPSLCGLGTTYGYSLIGDEEARRQIVSIVDGAARLAVVTNPLDSDTASGTTIAYAPLAQDSIVVGFNVDYRLYPEAAAADKNGLQVQDLTLNARLIAKLLTQSYRSDVPGNARGESALDANPLSLVTDPEFLKLNPEFVGTQSDDAPAGLMVALGSSDANALVWSWLRSDPLSQAFLSGEADDWGMTINPSYVPLSLATDTLTDSFPKADLTTAKRGDEAQPGYGTLDMRPYMNDMHEGAYRTLRADPNDKSTWDSFRAPAAYISSGAQVPGSRFVLSLTDAASAARYGLSTAKLVNGAGQPTAVTTASVTKSVALMSASADAPAVKVTNTDKRATGAYPLTMLSYAAVNVCASTSAELADYAKLIDYAVGAGQQSGDARGALPRGYVPLGADLVGQATATAASLANGSAAASCPTATPTATPTAEPTPVVTPTETPTPTPTPKATKTPKPTKTPVVIVPPVVTPAPVPTSTTPVEPVPVVTDPEDAVIQDTPKTPLGVGRAGLAGALALGIPSMIAGPILSRRGRKLARLQDGE